MQKIQFDGSAVLAATISVAEQRQKLDALLTEKGMIS